MKNQSKEFTMTCPVDSPDHGKITLAHGSGGRHMHRLVRDVFRAAFQDPELEKAHDGAILPWKAGSIAFTTDSYVVRPLFFPGGDIGTLAVAGTVNDLAMCGAQPLYLSCGFILEEGLSRDVLEKVAQSMRRTAVEYGVRLVTGDTKVVEHGKGDGIYVNTAGVGAVRTKKPVGASRVKPGDAVLLSGDVGAHGTAILSVRENLEFETPLKSDCASLWPQVKALIEGGIDLHCLRDLTRGGLATALNEIAESSGCGLTVAEVSIPVRREVEAACEVFGLDPLYMACEGRFIAFVPDRQKDKALKILKKACQGQAPALIGSAVKQHPKEVTMTSKIGAERVLDMLSGEQLPRIC